jgi:hypothetical protein
MLAAPATPGEAMTSARWPAMAVPPKRLGEPSAVTLAVSRRSYLSPLIICAVRLKNSGVVRPVITASDCGNRALVNARQEYSLKTTVKFGALTSGNACNFGPVSHR